MTTEAEDEDTIVTVQPARVSPPRAARPDPIEVPPPPPIPDDSSPRTGGKSANTLATSASRDQLQITPITPTFPSPAYTQSQLDVRRQMEIMMASAPQGEALSVAFDRPVHTRRSRRARRAARQREHQMQQLQQQQREDDGGFMEVFYRGLSWCLGYSN